MTAAEQSLFVSDVTVGPGRVDAVVRVASDRGMRTGVVAGLSQSVLSVLPGIKKHRCECGSSHGIAAELEDTETPHLLEHIALELMVLSGSPRNLRGDTRWDFKADGRGVFHVLLDYDDDLVALGALKEGTRIIDALLQDETPEEIERMAGDAVERLKELRDV